MKKILFVASEVAPYAKSGGLGDVIGSLPKELIEIGYDVSVIMPRYREIETEMDYVVDYPIYMQGRKENCIIRAHNQDINGKCTISQAEYSTLIEDILKFKKIYLGVEDNSYFNEQLDKFEVNISSKFEAISDYETSKAIINKRWYYAELTEDQISYISGVLTYHYEIKLYGDSPENEYAMLYEIPGANNEYIETFPNNVPEDSVATVKTSSNNQIGFYNVDYYTNATNLYSSINGAPFPQYSFNSNNFNQEKGNVLTKKYKND